MTGKIDLTKVARGKPCMIRLPGICDGGGETTVLCHFRMVPYNGTGGKPPDIMAAWGCGPCHAQVDGRGKKVFHRDLLRLYHLEGVLRTLGELSERGYLEGFK